MSNKIFILAPTGTGKSTSLRNLKPETTGFINADKKELPIRGWRTKYVGKRVKVKKGTEEFTACDAATSNYIETDDAKAVKFMLEEWEKQPHIETIVIDTITHMITAEYMRNTIGKDFKAYQALGKMFYDIMQLIINSKKNVIVIGHVEKKINELGDIVWEMKSHGNMIKDLVPASYFTTVLIGEKRKDGKTGAFDYVFRTQSEGNDPAKSPAFVSAKGEVETALELYEYNDIVTIIKKLYDFEHAGVSI
jgi:hypothetical protein